MHLKGAILEGGLIIGKKALFWYDLGDYSGTVVVRGKLGGNIFMALVYPGCQDFLWKLVSLDLDIFPM